MRARLVELAIAIALATPAGLAAQPKPATLVSTLKITILSANLSGNLGAGIGEWGFAALLEADGHRLLLDTGARPETVLRNAQELGLDLSTVTDLVITHNHADHVGGLVTLRGALAKKNPGALGVAHVASGVFFSRRTADGREANALLAVRKAYEDLGGKFIEHPGPAELFPGVWLTGPVPRVHPEERVPGGSVRVQLPTGPSEDMIPEDSSVVVTTPRGLVVLSGCCHAGMINTLDYVRQFTRDDRIHAAIGGFHLFAASDDLLAWTADQLRMLGVEYFLGAHCTGLEAVYRIRQLAGLARGTAVVGGVGASFTFGKGLEPLSIAR
jgi:7,8-dihydropterin-6-yl-methyl-4-(beta-D-ribofuranosyl)aminobenzene 5'-phosphate synthase